MSQPFSTFSVSDHTFVPVNNPGAGTSTPRGRPRGGGSSPVVGGSGAKRGRKPRTTFSGSSTSSPQLHTTLQDSPSTSSPQLPVSVHWAPLTRVGLGSDGTTGAVVESPKPTQTTIPGVYNTSASVTEQPYSLATTSSDVGRIHPILSQTGVTISLPGAIPPVAAVGAAAMMRGPTSQAPGMVDEDGDGEDELLPAMADDDYSAQLKWQSQSKDNLKVLMDSFSPEQYDRFEAYRRHALPKQAVRKVIQQTLGQQVSQPVAQIVAGFAKVFVGEIVEKARQVQERRREHGPLSPDHLREAYRMYQEETGRVGAARPLRSKKLFVR